MGLRTKELTIPPELMSKEFSTDKVVIRRLSASEKWRITDEAAPTVASSNNKSVNKVTISKEVIAISTCVKATVSAPWKVNDNGAYLDMDWELQDWLFEQIGEFNSEMLKKKENLSPSSLTVETENPSPTISGENS